MYFSSSSTLFVLPRIRHYFLSPLLMLLHLGYLSSCQNRALHLGMQEGNRQTEDYLDFHGIIQRGEVNSFRTTNGNSILHLVASCNIIECVQAALDAGAEVDTVANNEKRNTPLHLAAGGGHIEVVKLLLDRGAQVDAKAADGCTSLHLAAQAGHANIVSLLIRNRADPNACNNLGRPISSPGTEVMTLPNQIGSVILSTSRAEHVRQQCSGDYASGRTPLILAIEGGHVSVVEELLRGGANPNLRDSNTSTPLHLVAQNQNISEISRENMAQLLKEFGANPDAESLVGTAVEQAVNLGGSRSVAKEMSLKCCNCNKTSGPLLKCAGCGEVVYCSRACQKQNWRDVHKQVCKLFAERKEQARKESGK